MTGVSTNDPRIGFVVPRYGSQVVGGAETLCRMLAENLTAHGLSVDVLSTCARDHFSWANELAAGTSHERGVRVRRFPVGDRNAEEFLGYHSAIDCGASLSYGEQVTWMANSVWSPGILDASAEYDLLVAMPYLFGTTFWSVAAYPDTTVMIPCLHDEHHARQPIVLDALTTCTGLMLNASGEERLMDRLLADHRGGATTRNRPVVVGGGFDPEPLPTDEAVRRFCEARNIDPGYLLYAGRRERAKGLPELFDLYRGYRSAVAAPRPLALMGSGDTTPPPDLAPHVIDLGFVPTEERPLAYASASVLMHPSRMESFGLVLFEAWLAGTPAIVNAQSDVLREHCAASGGGLWYSDAEMFVEAVGVLTEDATTNALAAEAGREYTLTDFRWDAVRNRFRAAAEQWAR